ncbi:hypothetical protein L1F30_15640 [Simiduia sp. 21SJ11W-1]|uniref:hypothetical protein n=1 Tax=Simiduia sp. 21SJ11W-1 TaxID=2909669 RepID=UPI00209EA866|nr:hypothetical protein [Simiduia sp. 21SJ11W-1]UTA47574.1 hypothetical protein L1F30_15640 [Simiduia sp. 21SJ11W-1]
MDTYDFTKEKLIALGFETNEVEDLAKTISESQVLNEEVFKQFNAIADKLPWPQDHDFGALALQKWAASATKPVARMMIEKAIQRAGYCAQCSTSGGEGLARSEHVRELECEYRQRN